jgi:hypothetical protein
MYIALKIRPFVTEYHQCAIDETAIARVHSFIAETVFPVATPGFTHVTGEFYSFYDEPRYLGPISVAKYRYQIDIDFHYEDSTEEESFGVTLILNPVTGTFKEQFPIGKYDRPRVVSRHMVKQG